MGKVREYMLQMAGRTLDEEMVKCWMAITGLHQ